MKSTAWQAVDRRNVVVAVGVALFDGRWGAAELERADVAGTVVPVAALA